MVGRRIVSFSPLVFFGGGGGLWAFVIGCWTDLVVCVYGKSVYERKEEGIESCENDAKYSVRIHSTNLCR